MTSDTNSNDQLTVAEAKEMLRGASLRGTAARVAVVQLLAAEQAPLSHADVIDRLKDHGFDQSTLYRSLTELADAGILARLDLGESSRRFELIHGERLGFSEHPHFSCVECGKLFCLSDYSVSLLPKKKGSKGPGRFLEVLVKGYCEECDQAE